jgi:hypothetical protein
MFLFFGKNRENRSILFENHQQMAKESDSQSQNTALFHET